MNVLSELWKKIKRGKTDAEVAFEILVGTMSTRQRNELGQTLSAVQFAVDRGAAKSSDPRIAVAQQWVSGALRILEAKK